MYGNPPFSFPWMLKFSSWMFHIEVFKVGVYLVPITHYKCTVLFVFAMWIYVMFFANEMYKSGLAK